MKRKIYSVTRLIAIILCLALLYGCSTLGSRLDGSWRLDERVSRRGKRKKASSKHMIGLTFKHADHTFILSRGFVIVGGQWSIDETAALLTMKINSRKKWVTVNVKFLPDGRLVMTNSKHEKRLYVRN